MVGDKVFDMMDAQRMFCYDGLVLKDCAVDGQVHVFESQTRFVMCWILRQGFCCDG